MLQFDEEKILDFKGLSL